MNELRSRTSALPLFFLCPESSRTEDEVEGEIVRVDSAGPLAALGNAVHEYAAAWVNGDELIIENIAGKYGVEEEDLAPLCGAARNRWGSIKHYWANCQVLLTEQPLHFELEDEYTKLTVKGTSDIVGCEEEMLAVGDWKSGFLDTDHFHQLMGYAYGAWKKYGGPKTKGVTMFTIMLRTYDVDIVRVTVDELKDWAVVMLKRARDGFGTFNPGTHCAHCPRSMNCPGKMAHDSAMMVSLGQIDETVPSVTDWTQENHLTFGPSVVDVLRQIKYWGGKMDAIKAFVKEKVIEFGPLLDGKGRAYKIVGQNRRSLKSSARPVLTAHLGDRIGEVIKYNLTAAEKIVMEDAPQGTTKKAAKAALLDDLDSIDAISVKATGSLREGKE